MDVLAVHNTFDISQLVVLLLCTVVYGLCFRMRVGLYEYVRETASMLGISVVGCWRLLDFVRLLWGHTIRPAAV